MEFKIINDLKEAEKIWNIFSPNKYFWDLWESRICFIKGADYPIHFIVGYESKKVVGILPLWHDTHDDSYSWLGGEFPENNRFFIKDKNQINLFLQQCPPKTFLYYIQADDKDYFNGTIDEMEKYYLNPPEFEGLEGFLKTFSKKHRNSFKHDLKIIQEKGYQTKVNDYPGNIISLIRDYNVARFGDESFFKDEGFVRGLDNLLSFIKDKNLGQIITVEKDGLVVGAVLAVYYNNVYTMILGGSDPEVSNLGKLLMFKHFENAFALKAQTIDLMSGGGWKDLWNLPHYPAHEWHN